MNYQDKEWLEEKVNARMTPGEIADLCGCCRTTIHRWMKKFGLKRKYRFVGRESLWYSDRYKREREKRLRYAHKAFRVNRSCVRVDGHGYWRYSGGRMVHVVIAEKVLGRRLKSGEQVHHIDGNRLNNHHRNLLICDTSFHRSLEERIKRLAKCYLFNGRTGKSVLQEGDRDKERANILFCVQ